MRPALELAVAIARRDAAATPPVEPPRRLRPFLSMRRLSTSALDAVRRAVEESPALLRAMAAAAPTEDDVGGGRASWLFVHRPEGWTQELAMLEEAASVRSSTGAEVAGERTARRRLKVVEAELARLRAELDEARAASSEASSSVGSASESAALVEERRARLAAEAEVAELGRRVEAIGRERDAAHRRASAADKARAEAVAATADARADPAPVERDVAGARQAIGAAVEAVAAAADALEAAAGALGPPAGPPPARASSGGRRGAGSTVRLPVPLPPGLFEGDPAAADHLVRLPSAVLLVDGYNLSLRRWSDLPLVEQRMRLVDALNALAARVGVDVEVVFDGEENSGRGRQSSGGRRRAARVTFSPSAVDADEVLLDAVDRMPISRPVVVATDDRRVQREAAARGANVIGSAQLFAVLGFGG